jgi:hypothetical protein
MSRTTVVRSADQPLRDKNSLLADSLHHAAIACTRLRPLALAL